jgi:hypothetical protein
MLSSAQLPAFCCCVLFCALLRCAALRFGIFCPAAAAAVTSGTRKFEDPDLQKFYNLAEQFWKWTDDGLDAHDNDRPWPTWMPTAEVEGR